MTDVQNIEQLDKEEQINEGVQKLLKEIRASLKDEGPICRNFRVWLAITKGNIYRPPEEKEIVSKLGN